MLCCEHRNEPSGGRKRRKCWSAEPVLFSQGLLLPNDGRWLCPIVNRMCWSYEFVVKGFWKDAQHIIRSVRIYIYIYIYICAWRVTWFYCSNTIYIYRITTIKSRHIIRYIYISSSSSVYGPVGISSGRTAALGLLCWPLVFQLSSLQPQPFLDQVHRRWNTRVRMGSVHTPTTYISNYYNKITSLAMRYWFPVSDDPVMITGPHTV
jgi:hypothetical protein